MLMLEVREVSVEMIQMKGIIWVDIMWILWQNE